MEDYETIAMGLKTPQPKAALQKNEHLVLSHPEASTVARLPNSPEYNVILRIMEGVLETLETEHMQSWANPDLFERTGIGAVFARRFYEKTQMEINFHSSEFRGELEAATLQKESAQMTPEEFIRKGFGLDD